MLSSFTIDDDLAAQETGAIEVTLHLDAGERRWCYFITPGALAACGDFVSGSNVRFHYGAPHMIVMAGHLDRVLIERALRDIDARGDLAKCSLRLEDA
jgi:hypothetical protein